jgi:hypothetical protein
MVVNVIRIHFHVKKNHFSAQQALVPGSCLDRHPAIPRVAALGRGTPG